MKAKRISKNIEENDTKVLNTAVHYLRQITEHNRYTYNTYRFCCSSATCTLYTRRDPFQSKNTSVSNKTKTFIYKNSPNKHV